MYSTCSIGIDRVKDIGNRLRLRFPLGNWQVKANDSERLWPFYYSHSNNVLYKSYRKEWHRQGVFTFDCHQGNDEETFDYEKYDTVEHLPDDSVPVDVNDAVEGWRIAFYQILDRVEQPMLQETSFMDLLMKQPEYISQYYTKIDFHTVPFRIYEQLKSSMRVFVATDGGAIQYKGSLGFVIADADATILTTCFGQPSGHDPLSFRSEICAFLAAVKFITILVQYYDNHIPCSEKIRGKLQFYTDSSSMMKKLKAFDKYPTASLSIIAFLWLLIYVARFCAVDPSMKSSMLAWNKHISSGLESFFHVFNFLVSTANFDFLVCSCCSAVLPCTSSLRNSHSFMYCDRVTSTIEAPQT